MKLNVRKTIFVGVAFLIISLFWQVYDNIIAKMLINTSGLNQTWSGVVMALDNFLALLLLPLFGALSDRTKTRFGKRTPYIFFGVIIGALMLIGVALVDNMQLSKLEEENIPIVEVKVKDDDTTIYRFEYNGMVTIEYSMEEAQLARAHVVS